MKHNFLRSGWSAAVLACGIVFVSGCSSTEDEEPMPPGAYKPAPSPDKQVVSTAEPVVISKAPAPSLKPEEFVVLPPTAPKTTKPAAKPAAKTKVRKTAPAVKSADGTYVVKSGDSYWSIAKKFHVSQQALLAANKADASKPLHVGKKLIIPGGKASVAPAAKKTSGKTASSAKVQASASGKYVVKSGDSFSKIAKRFGIRASDLAAANNMTLQSTLMVGKTLVIPKAGAKVSDSGKKGKTAKVEKKQTKKTDAKKTDTTSESAPATDAAKQGDASAEVPAPPSLDGIETPAAPAPAAPAASAAAPVAPAADATAPATPAAKAPASSDSGFTVVLPKDFTVDEIAQTYGCGADEVLRLNPSIKAGTTVKKGTKVNLY